MHLLQNMQFYTIMLLHVSEIATIIKQNLYKNIQ